MDAHGGLRYRQSNNSSVLQFLSAREIQHSNVSLRPHLGSLSSENATEGSGVLHLDAKNVASPPLAIAFSKTAGDGHHLAVADEEGFISIFNTRLRLPSFLDDPSRTEESRLRMWMAHSNAIFDICWLKDDTRMLTASGDQTVGYLKSEVRLWDVEANTNVGVMKGHSGSVKSVCGHPSTSGLFVSGARDGNIAFWDARSLPSTSGSSLSPVAVIKDAHFITHPRKPSRQKVPPNMSVNSVTAVLYLRDECLLASAGASDGVLKLWDLRNLKKAVTQSPQSPVSNNSRNNDCGLSQDPSGTNIIASCTDSKIYMFEVLRPEKGHSKTFAGHVIKSFYIKAAFSPEGSHILSGSTDGNVFIWKVDSPEGEPVILEGHGGEVTAVDWCPTDFCKIATCSDDYTVRVWSSREARFEGPRQPSHAMRRRVCAKPSARADSDADTLSSPRREVVTGSERRCMSWEGSNYESSESNETLEGVEMVMDSQTYDEERRLVMLDSNSPEFARRQPPRVDAPWQLLSESPSSKKQRSIVDYFRCT